MPGLQADPLDAALELHDEVRDVDDWYAGVTDDPLRRLHEHAVDSGQGDCGWAECIDAATAAAAASYLHDWGYNGSDDRLRDDRVFVYVYAISDDTREFP